MKCGLCDRKATNLGLCEKCFAFDFWYKQQEAKYYLSLPKGAELKRGGKKCECQMDGDICDMHVRKRRDKR